MPHPATAQTILTATKLLYTEQTAPFPRAHLEPISDNLAVDVVNLDEIRLGPCASLASL